jgi:hypothetical protein
MKPVLWIPANATGRNPTCWHNPDSLCRTCVFQFLQEPFCETVQKYRYAKRNGIVECDGYEREIEIDKSNPLPSYTLVR